MTRMTVPKHIAIIMDGNGRWAKKRLLPRTAGHKAGRTTLKQTVKNCIQLGVKYLTAYTFSTENWRRPETEVSFLMDFFKKVILEEIEELHSAGVRIRFLGDLSKLSDEIVTNIQKSEEKTPGSCTSNEYFIESSLLGATFRDGLPNRQLPFPG